MVVVHAPVFLPISSIVFAASGIDEWTKPAALPSTSTLRGCFGLAGAVAGSAAIIASTCSGCGVWFCAAGAPRPPPPKPPAAGCGSAAAKPASSCSCVSAPVPAASHWPNQRSNVAFISACVTAPSLSVSTAVKNPGPTLPRPPAAPAGAAPCAGGAACCAAPPIAATTTTVATDAVQNFECIKSCLP